ncbi:SDR family NAD(P)-dependent oxidoreductase [Agarivorans sp. B2Z047]|uniref:NAD-dependent epimerase n=1 Tax=Agarivorans sp. B2Z047 TaxID=2652721 RepID=UPI00128DA6A1|nr:NAD-dependent epimerase [Agarivorans sp. B2Z047]MPW28723.1 SDR family NAD(P)-dependent oxidoreductase [Agarivorans sp. B2Z047]UQN41284.1 NAD-dependent epimerase [Agarivorans sp. B2Z047]
MKYLVTGAAGFIGFHVAKRLCEEGHEVVGIDNLNNYYDVNLKLARLERLKNYSLFSFYTIDLFDREAIDQLFAEQQFQRVIHLGAQAGVRYSLENPHRYADANLAGHIDILEGCSKYNVEHLVYASSSSVYGMNNKLPFSVKDPVDHPVSLYAATKRANELTSHTYSHLFGLPTTGLRFFTVYGPWGRPDMAPFKFTKAILEGTTIDVYNNGDLSRDFTYIDDIVEGVMRVQALIPSGSVCSSYKEPNQSSAPYALYNIGNGAPVKLMDFIRAIEKATGKDANKVFLPMQPGDVYNTWADTTELFEATGYKPKVGIQQGVERFVEWYKDYYLK